MSHQINYFSFICYLFVIWNSYLKKIFAIKIIFKPKVYLKLNFHFGNRKYGRSVWEKAQSRVRIIAAGQFVFSASRLGRDDEIMTWSWIETKVYGVIDWRVHDDIFSLVGSVLNFPEASTSQRVVLGRWLRVLMKDWPSSGTPEVRGVRIIAHLHWFKMCYGFWNLHSSVTIPALEFSADALALTRGWWAVKLAVVSNFDSRLRPVLQDLQVYSL